jgi:hypothetical protein
MSGRHEKQLIVHREADTVGGFRRLGRFPYWLRLAYVEELLQVVE